MCTHTFKAEGYPRRLLAREIYVKNNVFLLRAFSFAHTLRAECHRIALSALAEGSLLSAWFCVGFAYMQQAQSWTSAALDLRLALCT
jgi:uncharacterized membrane protein